MRIRLDDEAATEAFGAALAARLRPGDAVALYGTLGAGKTTLARGVLRGLGYQGDVASPTFPIVITYEPPQLRIPVWHVDLYRIECSGELQELGIDEAKDEAVLLIEWPERLGALWPETLKLTLAVEGGARALEIEAPVAWQGRIEDLAI
jgi:tRNA threonylcarbamoyladenosine biosynthesis protein TsaE